MAGTMVASVVKNDTTSPPAFQNSAGTEVGRLCRAWANFNPSGGSVIINGSFNVSSISYNAAGDYTANFTTAMPDANYAPVGGFGKYSPRPNDFNEGIQFKNNGGNSSGLSTTSLQISVRTVSGNGGEDMPMVSFAVFR